MVLGKLENHMQNSKTGQLSHTMHKNKLKIAWKILNVRPEAIKPLEEDIGSKLFDISLGNVFLDLSLQTKEQKQN